MNEFIYQADPDTVQTLHQIRERIHQCCSNCMHRKVRVQTLDGQMYEGTLAGMDHKHLYLSVSQEGDAHAHRQFYPGFYNPAANVILPLVLYELLVISLLY